MVPFYGFQNHRPHPGHVANRPGPRLHFQELLVLAVDLSPSMAADFRLPGHRSLTRIDALKEAAALFLTQKAAVSPLIAASVVGFSGHARQHLGWTTLDHLDRVLATVRSLSLTGSGTNIAGALETGLDLIDGFRTPPGVRRDPKVILISDGGATEGSWKHEALINRAASAGARISPIAIANLRDDPSTYDRDLLMAMARRTRGRFTTAQNLETLKHALLRA